MAGIKATDCNEKCSKFYDHYKYTPVQIFTINFLPNEYRNEELRNLILLMAELTGYIEIYVNPNRTDIGTGFVHRIRQARGQCPCRESQNGCRENKFAILTVSTAVHVFSSKEVDKKTCQYKLKCDPQNITMTLKYISPNKFGAKKIYGWKLLETDKDISEKMDWCCMEFVTHNLKLANDLEKILMQYQEKQATVYEIYKGKEDVNLVVVVGHPHGGIKMVSVGKKIDSRETLKEIRDTQRWCRYKYDAQTCSGSSGSPVLILGLPICGFGFWFGHPHNHAKSLKKPDISSIKEPYISISSIGAESIVNAHSF